MKLSNSSLTKYLNCPRSYKLHYRQRIVSKYKSSALFFGSAFDTALNEILEGRSLADAKAMFLNAWLKGRDDANNDQYLKTYPYVSYYNSDFDRDLLTPDDFDEIKQYYDENNLKVNSNPLGFIYDMQGLKKEEKFKSQDVEILKYYNMINWLCLKNKGQLMLEAYVHQIYPKFKKVLDIQKMVKLTSNCGDTVEGIIDLIVELQDGTVALIDNKTSSMDYALESVKISQQLTVYQIIMNNLHSDGQVAYKIDKCGYAVIKKRPIKDTIKQCKTCGFFGEGAHKTCDNVKPDGKRCGGEWNRQTTFSFETQFITDVIGDNQEDMVMETINAVNKAISHDLFLPNLNSCIGMYGKCSFFDLCHSNKTEDFIQLEEKTDEQKK